MSFLSLEGLCKSYGTGAKRTEVLRDVNLEIEEGELVAIVGYSGAGKTTLISMVGGLMKPDAGQITLEGKTIAGPGPDRGIVFQNYSLLPWLSAYQNIALAVDQVFSDWSTEKKKAHVEKYLDLVKLSAAHAKKPHELSGGMRQRVSVARALAMSPRILLLDEPFGALDALTRATLQEELERIFLADKKTVLLITNDVDEGMLLADRIIPLGAGPSATLGPSVSVPVPRPRDRRTLNHDPRFRAVRSELLAYLLGPGARRGKRVEPSPAAARTTVPEVPAAKGVPA